MQPDESGNEIAAALDGTAARLACEYEQAFGSGAVASAQAISPDRFRILTAGIADAIAGRRPPLPEAAAEAWPLLALVLPLVARWEGDLLVGAAAWEMVLSAVTPIDLRSGRSVAAPA